MKNYRELLRHIRKAKPVKNYLEIGIFRGETLLEAPIPDVVVGVDPGFDITTRFAGGSQAHFYRMTSDDFFKKALWRKLGVGDVDLCFIDGMHLAEYALRDFMNAEKICGQNSVIAIHDVCPGDATQGGREINPGCWMGDVYKIIPILDEYRPDLKRVVINDLFPSGVAVYTNFDKDNSVLDASYGEIVDRMSAMTYEQDYLKVVAPKSVKVSDEASKKFIAAIAP